ncbi:hypothetical protein MSG28_005515 [Choristoneura fumiferana]|uniref:Uncharacterized protein n=1 Tax=Choristoneura fumiferana TaxID=7141 RepID=A0ACC0KZ54_CHOFU|nr:hypothetical protein MSG28_005515 [Choristoneura fumiferana]
MVNPISGVSDTLLAGFFVSGTAISAVVVVVVADSLTTRWPMSDDHKVWRDKSYSGAARQERAAVVARVCRAWYRLGSIEILDKRREPALMRTLVEFIIKHHFPSIDVEDEDRFVKWYTEVAHRNLDMVATWQGVGFTHGVLNTDNVSVLGVTIDYGPYGFIDHYYESYVPNTSDDMGRYAFNRQPQILLWNLEKFALALEPILSADQKDKIKEVRSTLEEYVTKKVLETYLLKLGLKEIQDGDASLVEDLLRLMQDTMADFTCTFRQLAESFPGDVTMPTRYKKKLMDPLRIVMLPSIVTSTNI